jgi:hypothetical protein
MDMADEMLAAGIFLARFTRGRSCRDVPKAD